MQWAPQPASVEHARVGYPVPASPKRRLGAMLAGLGLPATLAGLTIYFGFEAGGYFANTTGWVAAGLAVTLAVRALVLGSPPSALTWPLAWAAGALAAFGLWTLLSASWSHAPSRALIDFDRVLLYLGALVLFATARSPERTLRRLPPAFLLAAFVLCGAGLFARTLPHLWPFALPQANARMDWPLTYENALGVFAALGLVFGVHVASWRREHPVTRILAAAALPVLAACLVLTFSRGGTLAAVVGLVAYLLLSRSLGAVTTLLAAGPAVFLAATAALDADELATTHLTTPAAIAQGKDLALAVVGAAALAAAAMALLLPLERRIRQARATRSRRRLSRGARIGATLALVLAVAGAAIGSGLVDRVSKQVVNQPNGGSTLERDRLLHPGSVTNLQTQSRPKYWRVALHAFDAHPLEGSGAGTFGELWDRHRPLQENATEGHSIYVETLGELGAVGALLIVLVLGTALWPSLARLRSARRPLYAALLAAGIAWLLHAGIDWDWEMPVLTLWLFATAGAALASSSKRVLPRGGARWRVRALVAAGMLLAAVTPAVVALSQDRLNDSVKALDAGDCRGAESSALSARSILPVRPEPYALVGYCEIRAGRRQQAIAWMAAAQRRDPRNWLYAYGLAVARAAAGEDPRAAARRTYELNPLEPLAIVAFKRFGNERRRWKRGGEIAQIPLDWRQPVGVQH